jgi:hypothetical protein
MGVCLGFYAQPDDGYIPPKYVAGLYIDKVVFVLWL